MATPHLQEARSGGCAACGTQIAPGLLACPSCHALVHAAELRALAEKAQRLRSEGDRASALTTWRDALMLLPPGSSQAKQVAEQVAALSREVEAAPAAEKGGGAGRWVALGGVGLLLWKFKFAVVFVLSKLKLLALGLSKGTTLFSMLASAGVYWAIWGWEFAFGIVLSIYVHEIGHVAALQRLGIKATAPMFIPGFGALVRMNQYPIDPREDARVGLAGPVWGAGAAAACYALWLGTGYGLWGALAEWGARINLFNLMPLGSLDGGRGCRALSRLGRGLLLLTVAAAWFVTREGMLVLVFLAGLWGAFQPAPDRSDRRALVEFLLLVAVLSALSLAAPALP
jgi:Zn-dependent protease